MNYSRRYFYRVSPFGIFIKCLYHTISVPYYYSFIFYFLTTLIHNSNTSEQTQNHITSSVHFPPTLLYFLFYITPTRGTCMDTKVQIHGIMDLLINKHDITVYVQHLSKRVCRDVHKSSKITRGINRRGRDRRGDGCYML